MVQFFLPHSVYLRPILEYDSIIWSRLKKDIELLEKVQRRFTKKLQGLKNTQSMVSDLLILVYLV